MNKTKVQAEILNAPAEIKNEFVVVRLDNGALWYYGNYADGERAMDVASTLGNGLVVKNIGSKTNDSTQGYTNIPSRDSKPESRRSRKPLIGF